MEKIKCYKKLKEITDKNVRKQALHNILMFFDLSYYNEYVDTSYMAICLDSFTWKKTKEGEDYWEEIYKKY